MFDDEGWPRADCLTLCQRIRSMPPDDLTRRQRAADRSMVQLGITFNVYGDRQRAGADHSVRHHSANCGRAMNGRCSSAACGNASPRSTCSSTTSITIAKWCAMACCPSTSSRRPKVFARSASALNPPRGVWCHITGTDLVRDTDGQYYVLEDNLRCPSGVSYVLQNRQLMKQTFPQLFERSAIRPVDDYCSRLLDALQYLMGDQTRSPTVALLSPGMHNSAYFEHSFLAQQMGIRPGRRSRPGRLRWLRLHADDERLRADRRPLPPHRRRLPRSESIPRRFDARRARA